MGKPHRDLAHFSETIIDEIESAAERAPFVIVDLERPASLMVTYAISLADLVVNGVPAFETQIDGRHAYRAVFSFGATLMTLDHREVGNISAAIENARLFTGELIAMLRNLAHAAQPQPARQEIA